MDTSLPGRSGSVRLFVSLKFLRRLALRLLILSGLVLPTLYLTLSTNYFRILVTTITPSVALVPNLTTLVAALALILWSFFRHKIPQSRKWKLFSWTPALWLSLFPSLFLLSSFLYRGSQLFPLAENFYLSWIAIGTLTVPYIVFGLLVSGILQFDDNILSPIGYGISIFVLSSFVVMIQELPISVPTHLTGEAIMGFKIMFVLFQMVLGTLEGSTQVQALLTNTLLYRADTIVLSLVGAVFVMTSLVYIFYRLGYFLLPLDRPSRNSNVANIQERPSVFMGSLRYTGALAVISVAVTYTLFTISWNYTIDPIIPLLIVFVFLLVSLRRVHR